MSAAVLIVEAGWLSTIQDAGRTGFGAIGVPTAGPVDRALADAMNRHVGNPPGTAVLETGGGLVVRAQADVLMACSAMLAPTVLRAGQQIVVGVPAGRNFDYVAFGGGLQVSGYLGSVSHDTLSGLGPPRLVAGMQLGVGPHHHCAVVPDQIVHPPRPDRIRVWPGPHLGMFAPETFSRLCHSPWFTEPPPNRIATRLSGPHLERVDRDEIASLALVEGAVQVHPDGAAMVMLTDHPTTGGYPVVAVVDRRDVGVVAQTPPGGEVRLIAAAPERLR